MFELQIIFYNLNELYQYVELTIIIYITINLSTMRNTIFFYDGLGFTNNYILVFFNPVHRVYFYEFSTKTRSQTYHLHIIEIYEYLSDNSLCHLY